MRFSGCRAALTVLAGLWRAGAPPASAGVLSGQSPVGWEQWPERDATAFRTLAGHDHELEQLTVLHIEKVQFPLLVLAKAAE